MLTKIICGVFLVSIAVAAVKYVSKCRRRLSDVNTEIERVLAAAAVDEALKESKLLKPAWNAFDTLGRRRLLDEIFPRRSVEDWLVKNDRAVKEQTDKICAAIEHLGAGGGEKIGKIFSDRVGEQMDRFSAALDRFSDSIDEKLKAADEISKIMNDSLLKTATPPLINATQIIKNFRRRWTA